MCNDYLNPLNIFLFLE